MPAAKKIRREREAHATRVYLVVDRYTGKAVRCEMTRTDAVTRRNALGKSAYRIEPAQAVPDSITKAEAAARND